MSASNKKNKENTDQTARRKRVNRFKTLIIFMALILLFTSVILNFALAIRVLHLEDQIDKLYSGVQTETMHDHFIIIGGRNEFF